MPDKISLNIGAGVLSLIGITSKVWNHYQYSAKYTRFDWITIVLFFLILLISIYREYKGIK